METGLLAGLSFGSIIVIAIIMAYYKVFGMVETIAVKTSRAIVLSGDMGIRQLEKMADEQIKTHNDWYIENELSAEDVVSATNSRKYYKALREGKVATEIEKSDAKKKTASTVAQAQA